MSLLCVSFQTSREPGVAALSSHVSTIDLPTALMNVGPGGRITRAASDTTTVHTSHIQDYKITSLTLHSLVKPLMERVVHLFGIMFYHLARSNKMRSEPPKMPRLEQPGHVATPAIGYSRHGNFSGSGFRHVYDVFIMSFDCRV